MDGRDKMYDLLLKEYNPDQPRDEGGRFGDAALEARHGIKAGDRVADHQRLLHTVAKVQGNKLTSDRGAQLHALRVVKI